MWSGNFQGAAEPEMSAWITQLEGVLAKTSRTPLFAAPMVIVGAKLSFNIDEETGEITYFNTTEGEHILSDGKSVQILSVTAAQAEHCGLSDGTADTVEELAVLLDLDEWNEIDDYGRKLANDWKRLRERATDEIKQLFQEFQGNVAFVGTREFYRPKEASPSGQAYHWNSNAETYYLIGDGMGTAMLHLLKNQTSAN